MARAAGQTVTVNGRSVYVEQSGQGSQWVVFEAGSGEGRTCWDPVIPLLADRARLVAYDRAGVGRSGRTSQSLGIDDMAADLLALIDTVPPPDASLVLVAHSMGGLVVRRAAERLGQRLAGLLLIDPTPETAPVYDTFDKTVRQVNLTLRISQALIWLRPLAWLGSGKIRRSYPAETYQTMLAENFTPSGLAQTRKELTAVAAAIHDFRAQPPTPPTCPTIVLSASRDLRRGGNQKLLAEHQRQYSQSLPDARFEQVDSHHLIQAEQPGIVAERVRELLDRAHPTNPPNSTASTTPTS